MPEIPVLLKQSQTANSNDKIITEPIKRVFIFSLHKKDIKCFVQNTYLYMARRCVALDREWKKLLFYD